MPEQLALQQPLREGRAVHPHERPIRPGAAVVDRVGHQFLARAALSLDQHRGRGGGDLFDQLIDLLHPVVLAHQGVEPVAALQLLPEPAQFRDVPEDHHGAGGFPLCLGQGVGLQHHPALRAVGQQQGHLLFLDSPPLADHLAEEASQVAAPGAHQPAQCRSDCPSGRHPHDPLGGPVEASDDHSPIHGQDAVGDAVEDRLQGQPALQATRVRQVDDLSFRGHIPFLLSPSAEFPIPSR